MSDMIDALLDVATTNVKRHFEEKPGEQLMQIWHGRAQDGRDVVIGTPYRTVEEKAACFRQVRDIFASQQVVAYVSAAEAWARNVMTGKTRDVVVIVAADSEAAKMRQLEIVRGTDGQVKMLVPDGVDKTERARRAGEVAGMLVTK